MDVEGKVINSIMVEKLHAALKFLTSEETELIQKVYYEGICHILAINQNDERGQETKWLPDLIYFSRIL